MIFDRLDRLGTYRGLAPHLDSMIHFLDELANPSSLPFGRIYVESDAAYINHDVVALALTQPQYEKHRTYIDIHIPLTQGEQIEYAPAEAIEWPDSTAETTLAPGPRGIMLDMTVGSFALFFPWDAHRPSIGTGECDKLICKIRCPQSCTIA